MARFARVILTGCAYHVTHRGNRQECVFPSPEDRALYCRWLGEYADRYAMEVWAYCLMTNHVHLIVLGHHPDSLANAIGRCHMRFARAVNRRMGWSGHLWANRFYSTPLDDDHLWFAVRYVELNPVRAGVVDSSEDYRWSSARAHCLGHADPLLAPTRPFPGAVQDWSVWLRQDLDPGELRALRANTATGRPTGSPNFVARLENQLERRLTPRGRGKGKKRGQVIQLRAGCGQADSRAAIE